MYKLNGEVFNIHKDQRIGDVNYPSAWFQDVTNRAAMGITEEPDPVVIVPLATLQAQRIASINSEAQTRIIAKYPLWGQSNCANGIYPAAYATQMRADIEAVISASNTATDAITAATDEAGVNSVTVVWPVI